MDSLRSKCAKLGFVMIFLLGHIQLTELAPAFSGQNYTREETGVHSMVNSQTEADKAIAKISADEVGDASSARRAEESNKSDGNGVGEQGRDAVSEEPAYAYDVPGKKVINQYGDNGGSPRMTAEFLGTLPPLLPAPSYSSWDHVVTPTVAGGESTKPNPMKKTSPTPEKKERNLLKDDDGGSGDNDLKMDIGVESFTTSIHPPLSPTVMLTTSPTIPQDDTNEKIIKLADVEKIDLKSMKKYQSQINAGGTRYGSAKKKIGGVVMGHDGVKVTKKKQLVEKGFAGDEVLMNNSDSQKVTDAAKKSGGVPPAGHLGPLVFRERTFNEHPSLHNAFVGKVNRTRGDGEERYLGSVVKVDEPESPKGLLALFDNAVIHTKIDTKPSTTEISSTSELYEITRGSQSPQISASTEGSEHRKGLEYLGKLEEEQKEIPSNSDFLSFETDEPLGIFQFHAKNREKVIFTTTANNDKSDMKDSYGIKSTYGTFTEKTTKSLAQEEISSVVTDKQGAPLTTLFLELGIFEERRRGIKENIDYDLLKRTNSMSQESINITPTPSHIGGHDTTIAENEMRSTQKPNLKDTSHYSEPTISPSTVTNDLPTTPISQTVIDIVSSTKFSPSPQDMMAESVTFFEISSTSVSPQNVSFRSEEERKSESRRQPDSNEISQQPTLSKENSSQIEIEINVSEGTGNMSRDLMQFSFRNSVDSEKYDKKSFNSTNTYMFEGLKESKQDASPNFSEYSNETDILVVEITDGENSTDGYVSNENQEEFSNENLKFAIHGERPQDFEPVKFRNFHDYDNINSKSSASRESNGEDDDLFVPDLKLEPYEDLVPITASSDLNNRFDKEAIDRDSDTIFYISNTEVKVVESVPTPNTSSYCNGGEAKSSAENFATHHEHHHSSKLESQFFPAIYEEDVIIDFPKKNATAEGRADRYEEDIILSPLKNNFDPLKIITNRNELRQFSGGGASSEEIASRMNSSPEDNMSVSYVAESFIDAHEFPSQPPSANLNRKDADIANESQSSDVIIQPAVIPEMSIGVPVIGELPPQIELKEIDFIPDNGNNIAVGGGGSGGRSKDANSDDDSIQYGGDLIANSAGEISAVGAFDMGNGYAFGGDRISGSVGDNDVTVTSQIVMHGVDNLQKNELVAELPGDGTTAFKDTSSKRTGNSSAPDALSNATAYSVLDDSDGEFNFTDVQTLFLACFATLAPLVLSVLLAFGLRYLWRKYRHDPSSGNGLVGDNSTDPLAAKSINLSQDELKSTESGYTINRSNDTLESSTEIVAKYDGCGGGVTVNGTATTNMLNHSGANGSVITMTLKNNHLIVETEERNDISRDARETKMHYTPSEKDGVFVVEVARGVDSAGIPDSPHKGCMESRQGGARSVDIDSIEKGKGCDSKPTNHEEVQIHQPPDGVSDHDNLMEVDENASQKSEPCPNFGSSNTGLSQSDLSTSSSGDSNKGYKYGNQQLYTVESDDTRPHSPIAKRASPVSPQEDGNCENGDCPGELSGGGKNTNPGAETKPVITAALLKQDTVVDATDKRAKCEENENRILDQEGANIEKLKLQLGNGEVSPVMDNGPATETENGFDSIISLPAPPSTEEIKQMNDVILMENSQLDSLPPPPPPENQSQTATMNDVNISGISPSTESQQNGGVAVVVVTGSS